jgi:hypothetical protein
MSLDDYNIQSGDDYADILIQGLLEIKDTNEIDTLIVEYWCIEIRKKCVEKYQDYIIGKEETFLLSDEEMDEAYRLGVEMMVDKALEDLSDKGLLEISISDTGEILYGLNEEGKDELKRLNDEEDI